MKTKQKLSFFILTLLFVPWSVLSAPKEIVLTGWVTNKAESRITVKTASGQVYSPDIGVAKLFRKNGTDMLFSEVLVGDKVQVKGTLWSDNSFSAAYLKNLSLYAKESTFNGKIISVSLVEKIVKFQTAQYGLHTVQTDQFTSFKLNGKNSSLQELTPGLTAQIRGVWERSRDKIQAKSIDAKLRLVSVEFTGSIVSKSPGGITVVVGNTVYGVDTSSAKFQNKAGKIIGFEKIETGQEVKVKGKHMSGDLKVLGEIVKQAKSY